MDVAFPEVADLAAVPTGDMPGDKVQITPGHIDKAKVVFPALWRLLEPLSWPTPGAAPWWRSAAARVWASPRPVPCWPTG